MSVFISGLAMRFRSSPAAIETQIAGPAVYACAGYAMLGGKPSMLAAISNDVSRTELDALECLGIDVDGLEWRKRPSIVLETPFRSGDSKSFKLSDNPLLWMPADTVRLEPTDVLFASNGDPEWLRRTIGRCRPRFLGLDLHATWALIRPVAMDACIRSADFVSATEEELSLIPSGALADLRDRNAIVMCKKGAAGVSICSGREQYALPSPTVSNVVTDVGAGDLLFGAMAAAAVPCEEADSRLSAFCRVYEQAASFVALLLQSNGPSELLSRLKDAKSTCPPQG